MKNLPLLGKEEKFSDPTSDARKKSPVFLPRTTKTEDETDKKKLDRTPETSRRTPALSIQNDRIADSRRLLGDFFFRKILKKTEISSFSPQKQSADSRYKK